MPDDLTSYSAPNGNSAYIFELPAIMDTLACAQLQITLRELLASHPRIILDTQSVERVSTTGIQLIISALKSASAHRNEMILSSCPSALTSAIEDLGLLKLFASCFTEKGTAA